MALNKVTYIARTTPVSSQNLNDIQDAIIRIDPADYTGKSIPTNADLNTYTTPGFYFCANSATAATLSNSPDSLSAGFSLVVLAKSTTYQTQLINSGGYLYFRQRSSNGWSSWYSTALLEINNTFKGVLRVQQANSDTSNTQSLVSVGNNIPEGTEGASYGGIQLYGSNDKYVFIRTPTTALGANRTISLPDATGTIQLVEDHTVVTGSASTTTIPTGTTTTVSTISLPAGTWVITGAFEFSTTFTQAAIISFSGITPTSTVRGTGTDGGGFCTTSIQVLSATTSVSLTAYQASGSNKTIKNVLFKAVKIA